MNYRYFVLFLLLTFVLIFNGASAQQILFYVNSPGGTPVNSITQGDTLFWQVNCDSGATVYFQIWMDFDASGTVTAGDTRLFQFTITDGDTVGDNGPSDIDGLNGQITSTAGAFGFAPIQWLFIAEENGTRSTGALQINPLPNPPATISGQVSFEDGSDPSHLLVATDFDHPPFWNAVTDANGNYTINLGEPGTYTISVFNTNPLYVFPQPVEVVANGDVSGVDFLIKNPDGIVKGSFFDDLGNLITDRVIGLNIEEVQTFQDVAYYEFDGGEYGFGLAIGDYRINVDDNGLIPDYMVPNSWENPDLEFSIVGGDTIVRDITFFRGDTVIYAMVYVNGAPANQPGQFFVQAWNRQAGWTNAANDTSGLVRLSVNHAFTYDINFDQETIPPGFGSTSGLNFHEVVPGDTVRFYLENFTEKVYIRVSLDPGDPEPNDWQAFQVWAGSPESAVNFLQLSGIGDYELSIPNETLDVGIWNPENYLVKPTRYEGVSPNDTVSFLVNFGNARIIGKLHGLDGVDLQYNGVYARSSGMWPDVYETWQPILPDSSYQLYVCEGTWYVHPPWFDGYQVTPTEVMVDVPETDTTIVVDFTYQNVNAIDDEANIPLKFELSQNYPNPFNPNTTIAFTLPTAEQVRLEVYNVLGQLVAKLVDGRLEAGRHTVVWDANNFPSGLYFYKIKAGQYEDIRKMMLLR